MYSKRIDNRSQITSIAFYQFELNKDANEHLGGTGIYLTSLVNFLKAQQHRANIRFIACQASPLGTAPHQHKLWLVFQKQWHDMLDLLTPPEEVLLFHYPKMPFIGRSNAVKVLLAALLAYGLLSVKKRVSGQRVVVLIQDLPIEMCLIRPGDAVPDLSPFYHPKRLSSQDRLFTWIERLIFKMADTIISPSSFLTEHIIPKHGLSPQKIDLKRRDIYIPSYENAPQPVALNPDKGLRVFYSGDLGLPLAVEAIRQVMQVFQQFPLAHLYLCGQQGDWVREEAKSYNLANVHYLGVLDHATYDAVAEQCDVGLLIYQHSYYDLMATAKYSAYVANGLATLTTDLVTLSQMVKEDEVGLAVPFAELPTHLSRWLQHPEEVDPYKRRARQLSDNFRQGLYMLEWFEGIL